MAAGEERSESTATEVEIVLKRREPTGSGGGDQLGFAPRSVTFGRVSGDCNRVRGLSLKVGED